MADPKPTGGLNPASAAGRDRGDPGGETDLTSREDPLNAEPIAGSSGLAGMDGGGLAIEAASLGAADGSLADRAGAERGPSRPAGRGGAKPD